MPSSRFPWTKEELDRRVKDAVQKYWSARAEQQLRNQQAGVSDGGGTRGEVLGGKHLDGFIGLVRDLAQAAGFSESEVLVNAGVVLPGYFRAQKKWDLMIVRGGKLCAAIEMKSHVGSFGNNQNNRIEEAIGTSTDFWAAYEKGVLGVQNTWLGYMLMVEDADRARRPVAFTKSQFQPSQVFAGKSYIDRYDIACTRLVLERKYSRIAYLASPRGLDGHYSEPNQDLSFEVFARALFGHLAGFA